MVKLGAFIRGPIEEYYNDRMTTYRYGSVTNEDGTTEEKLSTVPTIEAQPCRLSFVANRQEDPKDSNTDSNPILAQPKVFCAPDIDVQAGDYFVVQRMADDGETVLRTYTGPCGLPYHFPSHMEFLIGEVRKV